MVDNNLRISGTYEIIYEIKDDNVVVHQEEIKIPKILLSKPEFNVDFKSVLIFATVYTFCDISF